MNPLNNRSILERDLKGKKEMLTQNRDRRKNLKAKKRLKVTKVRKELMYLKIQALLLVNILWRVHFHLKIWAHQWATSTSRPTNSVAGLALHLCKV